MLKFFSRMTDSCNHKHTILVPILVRYFIPQQGVKLKTLKFTNLSGESAAQLTEHIVHVVEETKLRKIFKSNSPFSLRFFYKINLRYFMLA
jgi:hypothetical protein